MATVHTHLGPGEIIAEEVVRGRKSYRVAGNGFDIWLDETKVGKITQGRAPVDFGNSTALPYNPKPQVPAIPGNTESTIQPPPPGERRINPDERLRSVDSVTFEDREESHPSPKFAGWQHDPENHPSPYGHERNSWPGGLEPDYSELGDDDDYDEEVPGSHGMFGPQIGHSPVDHERQIGGQPYYDEETNRWPFVGARHEGWAQLIPLALEGLEMAAPALGRAAGGAALDHVMGGGDDEPPGGGAPPGTGSPEEGEGGGGAEGGAGGGGKGNFWDKANEVVDALRPGAGWGPLIKPGGLSDKYIDITASADYHNDPVAQFRHDPDAYISRVGNVLDETDVSNDIHLAQRQYMDLVEGDPQIREAAWKDVREKGVRLRGEGRVAVHDISPSRIMATVEGDNGVYDVMISREGMFGGVHDGYGLRNWRCACLWGQWAWKRKYSYVGRLCSHGYAAFLEMQSANERKRGGGYPKRSHKTADGSSGPYDSTAAPLPAMGPAVAPSEVATYGPGGNSPSWESQIASRRTADALQMIPTRLTPELAINDTDDAAYIADVTKDERHDTGPGDVMGPEGYGKRNQGIEHFSSLMLACDRLGTPYPRELVAYLEKRADDDEPREKRNPSGWGDLNPWNPNSAIRNNFNSITDQHPSLGDFAGGDVLTPGYDVHNPLGGGGWGQNPLSPEAKGGTSSGAPAATSYSGAGANIPGGGENPTGPMTGGDKRSPVPEGQPGAAPSNKPGESKDTAQNPNQGQGGGSGGQGGGGAGGGGWKENDTTDAINTEKYTVGQGDTLSDIAQRSGWGENYQGLADAAGIKDPNVINTGQEINLGKPKGMEGGNDLRDLSTAGGKWGAPAAQSADAAGTALQGLQNPGLEPGATPPTATPITTTQNDVTSTTTPNNPAADLAADNPTSPVQPENMKASSLHRAMFLAANDFTAPQWWIQAEAQPSTSNVGEPKDSTTDEAATDAAAVAAKADAEEEEKPEEAAPTTNPAQGPTQQPTVDPAANQLGGGMGDMGGLLGTGLGAAADIGSGLASNFDPSMLSGVASGVGNMTAPLTQGIGNAVSGLMSGIGGIFGARQTDGHGNFIEADRSEFGYPSDQGHIPFNGSGPLPPLKYTTSDEEMGPVRRQMEDVTHRTDGPSLESLRDKPRHASAGGGIQRAGSGPKRPPVVPEVVQIIRPQVKRGGNGIPDIPDPYSRTASSFSGGGGMPSDDPEPFHTASASDDFVLEPGVDIVAQFQRSAAAENIMSNNGGQSNDDLAGAASAFLQRTAGRNFSMAEQAELMNERHPLGARNLDQLDLTNTHYEAENSVGLFM